MLVQVSAASSQLKAYIKLTSWIQDSGISWSGKVSQLIAAAILSVPPSHCLVPWHGTNAKDGEDPLVVGRILGTGSS